MVINMLHVEDDKLRCYILFNFCVSAHALRDWVIKYLNLDDAGEHELHERLNSSLCLQLVRDIANSTKHFGLETKRKSFSSGVQESTVEYVNLSSCNGVENNADTYERKSFRIVLSDGSFVELHDFVLGVYREWLSFFKDNDIPYGYFGNEALLFVRPEYLEQAKNISYPVND